MESDSQIDDAAVNFVPRSNVKKCTGTVRRCERAGIPCDQFCGYSHVRWVTPHQSSATATWATSIIGRVGAGHHPTWASRSALFVAVGGSAVGKGVSPQLWTASPRGPSLNTPIRASKGMTCRDLEEIGFGRGRGFSPVVFPTPLRLV